MRLLIKYPTRQRPGQFAKTIEAYSANLSDPSNTRIMVTVDRNDRTMEQRILHVPLSRSSCIYEVNINDGIGKIAAINSGMDKSGDWDIVLLASDDMIPQVFGYDDIIRTAMRDHYPDTDGALWINDGRQDAICTIVCMGRKYAERFGLKLYHPSYKSLWCDNEWTDIAVALGKITKLPCIIRNESPDWGGNQKKDRLYLKNNSYFRLDQRNYERRKAQGFPWNV